MLTIVVTATAFWLTAAMAGAMLFFGAVVAPAVVRTLPEEQARVLMRVMLPRYHLVLGSACLLTGLAATLAGRIDAALVLGVVTAGFVYARQSIVARVNALEDMALAGDEQAQADFERTHRMSTALNMVQFVALLAVAYGLARGA